MATAFVFAQNISTVAEVRMDLALEISEPCPQPLASAAESLAPPAARP